MGFSFLIEKSRDIKTYFYFLPISNLMGSLLKSLGYTAKDVVDAADKLIINL
ncbi:MAG: hypothetical protein ACJAUL_003642, partial [Paraglaciecola sp.]